MTKRQARVSPWKLNKRHALVMDMLCKGSAIKEIAAAVGRTPRGVQKACYTIQAKIADGNSRLAAARWAVWRSTAPPEKCPTRPSSEHHTSCERCGAVWANGNPRACVRAAEIMLRATEAP